MTVRFTRGSGIRVGWLAAVLVLGVGAVSYWRLRDALEISRRAERVGNHIAVLDDVLSLLRDAETGQRGFLLTGDSGYLEPYHAARRDLAASLTAFRALHPSSDAERRALETMEPLIQRRVREIDTTIALRESEGYAAAARVVRTNSGKRSMDSIRALIAGIDTLQSLRLSAERRRLERSVQVATVAIIGATMAAFVLAMVAQGFMTRAARAIESAAGRLTMANAELEETSKAAAAADEAKRQFLAVMSHELRTPLNAIQGYASLLADPEADPLTDKQAHAITRVQTAARALVAFIDEMLAYAKLGRGDESVHPVAVDVSALVGDAVSIAEHLFREKGLSLEFVPAPLPITVTTDVPKVTHILLNLLANAAKFTSAGGARVVVRPADEFVVIDIVDTGLGIRPEDQTRIFDPFVRVDSRLSRSTEGAGMGLATASRLASLLGGSLTVQSEAGNGSTFSLRIPAGAVLSVPQAGPAPSSVAVA